VARIVEDEFADMPGQDSFLDILTNMVGIIILLVVVTGLRTSQATVRAAVEKVKFTGAADEAASKAQLQNAQRSAVVAESDLKGLMRQVVEVRGETALRDKERTYLSTYVAAFEQELNERRSTLSAEQQRDYDLRRKLAESQVTLESLSREQVALLSQPTDEVKAIENQPTPLARRSTGREVLLHLSGGYLAVIPHELVAETISDVNANLWRLRDQDRFINTVGPINGFRLRYLLGMVAVNVGGPPDPNIPGASQLPMAARPELIWYEIIPEKSPLGEPVAKAIEPNSEFRQVLREHPCDTAVVVIAVYPDSIRELHDLKRELYAAGYATAEVPCLAGRPIKGSPRAPRSGQIFVQ
jgi:hypothetical protein